MLQTARKWFGPGAAHRRVLAVVILVELILFAGFHLERWHKSLQPRHDPQTDRGEGLVIRCDGHGYYAWLRSLLLDGDWSFDNEFDEHNPLGDYVTPREARTAHGLRPNQWSVGPACVWAVTVVPGHFCLRACADNGLPWPADGYSLPYQLLVGCTTLLTSFAGLGFLYGLCRRYADPGRAALAAGLLTLGSGIVFYGAVEVTMAHSIGPAAVAALAWYWQRTYGAPRPGRWLVVGLLIGLAALMRWQLVTFAVLPAGEFLLAWRRGQRGAVRGLALAALGAVLAFLPQVIAWYAVYGRLFVTPIPVGHNWTAPDFARVLLDVDRGLFYWTPLTLVACLGFLCWFRRPLATENTGEPLGLLFVAFALQVYVLASLWGEGVQLGVSYGLRHFTETVVVLGPGLALLLARGGPRQFRLVLGLSCLLMLWNLLVICQYRYGWIPAAGGASPGELLGNVPRLIARKRFLLVGQALAGPALLWLLGRRLMPHGTDRATTARQPLSRKPALPMPVLHPRGIIARADKPPTSPEARSEQPACQTEHSPAPGSR
jgi:hypothetical protein